MCSAIKVGRTPPQAAAVVHASGEGSLIQEGLGLAIGLAAISEVIGKIKCALGVPAK